MNNIQKKAKELEHLLDSILDKIGEYEHLYTSELQAVHPGFKKSARNLIHYLAIITFDLPEIQSKCMELGVTGFKDIQVHVVKSLFVTKNVLRKIQDKKPKPIPKGVLSRKQSQQLLRRNTKLLFGYKSRKRRTRIMVTMPDLAATDYSYVKKLIQAGMNSARINCAHDGPDKWLRIVSNVRKANRQLKKKCKIIMDLSGPKLRTGIVKSGPEVIHVKPTKNLLGQVVTPAKLWLGSAIQLPVDLVDCKVLPLHFDDVKKLKKNDLLSFKDSRGKSCKIKIGKKYNNGFWAYCNDSAYITSGRVMRLKPANKSKHRKIRIGSLKAVERHLLLKIEDELILHKDGRPGESSEYDESGKMIRQAHISCTLPEVFKDIRVGERVFFDDGKIAGKILEQDDEFLRVLITHAKFNGSKLKADKGINFPDSAIDLKGLTDKDKEDLQFVTDEADAVNLSFINDEEDVRLILKTLARFDSKIGLILKIETKSALDNLGSIILRGMQHYPVGVLIARGDLAVEAGWEKMAFAQEEIMRTCKAAHLPSVWATQVLENYAKKGIPSRAELTDVVRARKTECIMLNKGPYILQTIQLLSNILQSHKRNKQAVVKQAKGKDLKPIAH
jgi:pyruvate kinase